MNIVQIQSRVQELPNSPQTMQYLNAAMNGQVTTVPPYIAAAELKRRETEGMMDQLAKGAAQAQQSTVKDQLQQKMGIMALMGQQQPPQPPQIPQPAPPEQQPQAGGIDSLPVKEDMFGMAGGGIVAFQSGGGAESSYDRMNRLRNEEAQRKFTTPVPLPEEEPIRLPGESLDAYRSRLRAFKETGIPNFIMRTPEQLQAGRRADYAARAASDAPTIGGPMANSAAQALPRSLPPAMPRSLPPAMPSAAETAMAMNAGAFKPPSARPPAPPPVAGPRPAARPPVDAGISLADQAPGLNLADALDRDPAVQRMKELAVAANPYGGRQESQEDFIKRRNQGILSQIPGGKKPYETSEARLKEIEARRAKEDTEYADLNKGRQLDNLLTFISGMGRGSFGNAGAQGIQAVQGVERDQRAEDLKRKDLRDQQSMKLMEIRTLNDQAQYAEATGNVTEFERLNREIKKLENEYAFKQAELSKELATLGAGARGKDVETKQAREKLRVESEDRAKERDKDVQVERIRAAGQAAARASGADDKTVKMAEDAFTRDPEAQAIKKRLESSVNPAKRQTDLTRLREIQAEKYRQFGIRLEGAPSPAPAAGGDRPPLSSFQR